MIDGEASPTLFDDDRDLEPHSAHWPNDRVWEPEDVRAEDQRATKYVRPANQVYVRSVCYRQTGEQRFGHEAKEAIDAFLYEHYLVASTEVGEGYDSGQSPGDGDVLPDLSDEDFPGDDEDDEDDEDYEEDDEAQGLGPDMATSFNPFLGDTAHVFPRMQRVRNCLTALSQQFNLYFAAYQDKIYVYRPQQPPQILPDESLILRPKQSVVGKRVGGALNWAFGHQVNHLIVGELGDLEVLFFCYDDGDVAAYYTHQIARYILERSGNPHMASPKAFFHSNVGKSAWGLAVHKQSRLLAVTCNKHEVTVFAFSVTDHNDGYNPTKPSEEARGSGSNPVLSPEFEKHYQSRTRTWHIILCVNEKGRNMPNLTFCDDADGNAEKVVAVDITGNIWIIDIWKLGSQPVVYPEPGYFSSLSRGWGVLILSESDFKPTNSYCEAFGLPKNQIIRTSRQADRDGIPWLDITCSLFYLRDSAVDQYDQLQDIYSPPYYEFHLKALPVNIRRPDGILPWVYPPGDEQDVEDSVRNKPTTETGSNMVAIRHTWSAGHNNDGDSNGTKEDSVTEEYTRKKGLSGLFTEYERKEKINFSRIISPGIGLLSGYNMCPDKFKQFLDGDSSRRAKTVICSYRDAQPPSHHSKMSIFYTDQSSVELQPLDFKSGPGIRCENVLSNYNHHEGTFPTVQEPWDQSSIYSERISIIRHVRELNLIVCGSLCGRVALITLTKARRYHADMPFRHGFRVDAVLPRRSDEDKRMRPWAPLHGLAVSPVPDHKARGLDLQRPERGGRPSPTGQTYRLMLHYLDHSILLYHFARSEKDDELLIF